MTTKHVLMQLMIAQPEAAAKLLASKPVDEAATAINLLQGQDSAALLQYAPPRIAADWLLAIESSEKIKDIVANIDVDATAHIIATLTPDLRQRIFNCLNDKVAKKIQIRIHQQHKWIGDFIDDETLTLTPDISVGDAKALLRQHVGHAAGDRLFVLDQEFKLQGNVMFLHLITADEEMPIKAIMQPISHSVNSQSDIYSIANADIWQERISLPVVDVDNKFVGLVKRSDLEQYATQSLSANTILEDLLLALLDLVQLVWINTVALLSTGLSGRRPQ